MLGWLSDDADRASSTKRRTRSSLRTRSGGRILSATFRPSVRSCGQVDLAHAARAERRDHPVVGDLVLGAQRCLGLAAISPPVGMASILVRRGLERRRRAVSDCRSWTSSPSMSDPPRNPERRRFRGAYPRRQRIGGGDGRPHTFGPTQQTDRTCAEGENSFKTTATSVLGLGERRAAREHDFQPRSQARRRSASPQQRT